MAYVVSTGTLLGSVHCYARTRLEDALDKRSHQIYEHTNKDDSETIVQLYRFTGPMLWIGQSCVSWLLKTRTKAIVSIRVHPIEEYIERYGLRSRHPSLVFMVSYFTFQIPLLN